MASIFAIVVGVIFIVGAYRRWSWLVDPPVGEWSIYSQAYIKKRFGSQALLYFTYVLGALFIVVGLIKLWGV